MNSTLFTAIYFHFKDLTLLLWFCSVSLCLFYFQSALKPEILCSHLLINIKIPHSRYRQRCARIVSLFFDWFYLFPFIGLIEVQMNAFLNGKIKRNDWKIKRIPSSSCSSGSERKKVKYSNGNGSGSCKSKLKWISNLYTVLTFYWNQTQILFIQSVESTEKVIGEIIRSNINFFARSVLPLNIWRL